jgi:IS30 family transposase
VDREKVVALKSRGMSIRCIAQTVGVPRSTVARALASTLPAALAGP